MTNKGGSGLDPADLRRRAEELLRGKPADLAAIPPEEAGQLLHELQVHQVELEMQNDELRRAQQDLEASRVKYFDLFDKAPVGYLSVSEKGLILEANLRGAQLLGVGRTRLVKQPLTRYIVPEDQDIYYLHRKRALETGARQGCEVRMFRQDGSPFWARLETGAAREDENRTPVCRVTVTDITEQKRAEEREKLHASEEWARTILHTALDGFWMVDGEGRLLEVNEAYCRMSGYDREELLGKRVSDLDATETAAETARHLPKIFAWGQDLFETVHRRKDGSTFDIEASVQVQPVHGGQIVVFLRDITNRKRAEAEKEKMQSQLQQAMKMEAVGRLAGGIAHDFNNLLTVIIGNVSLVLRKVSPSEPIAEMLSDVSGAADRAARLVRQLLAFSRKQIIEPKVLDLNALIVELRKLLVRLIGENIELDTISGKGLGAVRMDPGQFEQILVNLAVNARDAMRDGGRLTIETSNVGLDDAYCAEHPDATPGRFVLLSVSDTGHGMNEEVKAQIFEPFFTTKPVGRGTGLGLSMAYGAVTQAGGSIAVHSEVGKGTTVRIYLPRVMGEVLKPVESVQSKELPEGTETVLLVEDDAEVQRVCVRVLERLGYKVLKASHGTEAISVAQEYGERIDLLLTDVVMPGIKGSDLATQLVLMHPEVKVLFTSGYTGDVIVHHGVLDDGVSFIGKPYTPWALSRKVREVLDTD